MSAQEIIHYQAEENSLKDRVVMVTGAGSGIGKSAAIAYAAAGAMIILAGRTVEKLEAVYDQIIQTGGKEPLIYPVDFEGATEDDFNELANQIDQQFGRLDGLLLNAGVLGQRTPLAKYRQDVWDKVFRVNVSSQHLLTKALMPVLEASDNASVIFTTSGVGRVGRAFWGAYAASKFAIGVWCKFGRQKMKGLTRYVSTASTLALLALRCALRPFLQRTQKALHRLRILCLLIFILWAPTAIKSMVNRSTHNVKIVYLSIYKPTDLSLTG